MFDLDALQDAETTLRRILGPAPDACPATGAQRPQERPARDVAGQGSPGIARGGCPFHREAAQ